MLSIRWDMKGLIHFELLDCDQMLSTGVYCAYLVRLKVDPTKMLQVLLFNFKNWTQKTLRLVSICQYYPLIICRISAMFFSVQHLPTGLHDNVHCSSRGGIAAYFLERMPIVVAKTVAQRLKST
jgi:hypothetical protein